MKRKAVMKARSKAIFRRPKEGVALCGPENPLPVTLIMDQIRDPGCVDVWESKVLRAGAGSHFRVPIISNLPWESIPGYISDSTDVLVADLHRPTQKRVENVGKSSVDNESLEELFDAQDRKEKGESDSDGEMENESDGETENESDSESDTEKEKSIDDSYKDNDFLQKYENAPLPM
ncbi:hypothetical protein KUTeg_009658 [Tegillarca granosa]|uniref:Uncharacterized protein n=1 Tax=Tegillarca granosa TaxID=220873 RepID=A0ABQ9F9L8_TEGGR|nr:hypothetical protein KUTeg_009658 [Tegillarca granosa]